MLNLLIKVMVGLVFSFTYSLSHAADANEKANILNVMKKYVESTSCSHTFQTDSELKRTTINDVYLISDDQEVGDTVYFVLWGGDIGCNVGSGTMSYYMSEVSRFSKSRPFLVQSNEAFGQDININFRFLQSVKQIAKDQFEIISWNYADDKYGGVDGGNNFPANKFKYILKSTKDDGWQISNQLLIEQNN